LFGGNSASKEIEFTCKFSQTKNNRDYFKIRVLIGIFLCIKAMALYWPKQLQNGLQKKDEKQKSSQDKEESSLVTAKTTADDGKYPFILFNTQPLAPKRNTQ
jgi:hypothetical protein